MPVSVFDLFSIGIGPSSSHTVGPMRAARRFAQSLLEHGLLEKVAEVKTELYGSLGATGKGHGTDKGVMLGLMGYMPNTIDPDGIPALLAELRTTERLPLLGKQAVQFQEKKHIVFFRRELMEHPNGMRFQAFDQAGSLLLDQSYLSVGGGAIVAAEAANRQETEKSGDLPFSFNSGEALLSMCRESGNSIAQLMLENERFWRSESEVRAKLLQIWQIMQDCVKRGCQQSGNLPGPLQVRRRAPDLHAQLSNRDTQASSDPLFVLDWLNLYAMAVNEENAAGGRVVTAPTNGAAGIIPAVLHYYERFVPGADVQGAQTFLLAAAASGAIIKRNASTSGAEVGCQGEVGSACAMAAAGLAAALGGTPAHVENAAEIGIEHNLGLTCDPIGGLVQLPCIERNALAAVKAVSAARLAVRGDGQHFVSLDKAI